MTSITKSSSRSEEFPCRVNIIVPLVSVLNKCISKLEKSLDAKNRLMTIPIEVGSESISLAQILRLAADSIDQTKQTSMSLSYEELGHLTTLSQRHSEDSKSIQSCQDPTKAVMSPSMAFVEKQTLMLQAITAAHANFVASAQPVDLFNNLLNAILLVAESPYGFIGEVKQTAEGAPYLQTYAITNLSWNQEMMKLYQETARTGLKFYRLDNLFGWVIRTGQVLIANNPSADPRAGGFPSGHPVLKSFCGIPLKSQKTLVGMVGLADRPEGYNQELVDFLEPILVSCATLIDAYKINRAKEQAQTELLLANQQLEAKVRERTQDLNNKNLALEKEIEMNKQITTQLQQAKNAADKAAAAKSNFLSAMSHELRTPLIGVIGMAELLADTPLADEQKEYATTISKSAMTLHYLINNILDVSKIEAGKLELVSTEFNLAECLEEVMYMVAVNAHQKDIDLVIDIDREVPKFVIGDVGRVKQILLNLVQNAVKFTEKGTVGFYCKLLQKDIDRGKVDVQITVLDTGIGIPEDSLPNLFKMFSQADPSISQRFGGTGLGLYLAKKLLTQMGGSITVESEKGKGSQFTLVLPLELSPQNSKFEKEYSLSKKGQSSQLNALIVESHKGSSAALHKYLVESEIAKATTASTLEEALQLLTTQIYDVAFIDSDLMVPDCSILNPFLSQLLLHCPHRILLKSLTRKVPPKIIKHFTGSMLKPVKLHILEQTLSNIVSSSLSPLLSKATESHLSQSLSNNTNSNKADTVNNSNNMNSSKTKQNPSYKILLVDDNMVNCRVGQKLIQKLGHNCDIATSGQQALELFHAHKYDMIFMDIIMPEMDGYKTTKLIRETERTHCLARTPIVALTAVDSSDQGFDEGMDDYLAKPVQSADLSEMIRKHLRKNPLELS